MTDNARVKTDRDVENLEYLHLKNDFIASWKSLKLEARRAFKILRCHPPVCKVVDAE